MNRGILYGIVAYLMWGVFPIYWKFLKTVPPLEILCHRIVWSTVFTALLLLLMRRWNWLRQLRPRVILWFVLSAMILAINWLVFIYAVNGGAIVEASLGYFINPLFNVLLGFLLLKERLRPVQTASIAVAASGVAWLTLHYGSFPWIALSLAVTFGVYGLLRKTAPLGSLEGLFVETLILAPAAVAGILFFQRQPHAVFLHQTTETILLWAAGAVTAVPLLLFSSSARRISLTALGLLQYIAPTLQFLIGVLIYGEPFDSSRFIGFAVVWTALALYLAEGFYHARQPVSSPDP